MGIAFAICRTAKIKSLSALKAHAGHAARTRETLNATTALTPCNDVLVGSDDPAHDALARLSILPNRPSYQQLRTGIENRQFDIVVAESLSRLSRDEEQCYNLHNLCKFNSVRLYTLSEGEINEILLSVVATMGAMQRRATSDQAHRGIRGKVKDGSNVSRPPYGYRIPLDNSGMPIKGQLEVHPDQAAIVIRTRQPPSVSWLSPAVA